MLQKVVGLAQVFGLALLQLSYSVTALVADTHDPASYSAAVAAALRCACDGWTTAMLLDQVRVASLNLRAQVKIGLPAEQWSEKSNLYGEDLSAHQRWLVIAAHVCTAAIFGLGLSLPWMQDIVWTTNGSTPVGERAGVRAAVSDRPTAHKRCMHPVQPSRLPLPP